MAYIETYWTEKQINKLDTHLRSELLAGYERSKASTGVFHSLTSRFKSSFKKIDVLIRFSDDAENTRNEVENKVKTIRHKSRSSLKTINSMPVRLSEKKIKQLAGMDSVKTIYLDRKYKALLNIAAPSLNTAPAWNAGLTGKGITAAVIDTGIYPHDDLVKPANRILAFKDLVKKMKKPYDDNGHGTHVAGDIASNGLSSQGLYKAPAYESSLVGVKVLDKQGSGSLSKIIEGVEWCIENKDKYNIRIINLSLGAEASGSYKDDLMCEACEAAWNAGIVVCAAAGNEGPVDKSIASPGVDPVIITVGAIDDRDTAVRNDDRIADFSSRGPTPDGLVKPDIVTPGVNIVSLRSPCSYLDRMLKSSRVAGKYLTMSGTSMATPLCCSSIALLLEKNPLLTPDEIKKIITGTAQNLGIDRNFQGSGYLNEEASLNSPAGK